MLEEKAVGIKQTCADGRISGQVYDCELEVLDIVVMDIESIKDTLRLFVNIKSKEEN